MAVVEPDHKWPFAPFASLPKSPPSQGMRVVEPFSISRPGDAGDFRPRPFEPVTPDPKGRTLTQDQMNLIVSQTLE